MSINLVSQWWNPECQQRASEIQECRAANESSGLFSECVYLDGSQSSLTYKSIFAECVDRFPGQLCVVANTDIIFDETILGLTGVVSDNDFVALTRWDSSVSPRMIGHILNVPKVHESNGRQHYDDFVLFSGSQDAWAFIASERVLSSPDVYLGLQACDQVIASWAVLSGMRLLNPSLSVRSWHRHETFFRKPTTKTLGGLYAYPQMTTLEGVSETMVAAHEWKSDAPNKWPPEWKVIRCQQ
jgi:hypothetical protein